MKTYDKYICIEINIVYIEFTTVCGFRLSPSHQMPKWQVIPGSRVANVKKGQRGETAGPWRCSAGSRGPVVTPGSWRWREHGTSPRASLRFWWSHLKRQAMSYKLQDHRGGAAQTLWYPHFTALQHCASRLEHSFWSYTRVRMDTIHLI